MTDRRVEDGERLCRVQGDENPHQELLVFGLQGLSEAVDDAGGGTQKRKLAPAQFGQCSFPLRELCVARRVELRPFVMA